MPDVSTPQEFAAAVKEITIKTLGLFAKAFARLGNDLTLPEEKRTLNYLRGLFEQSFSEAKAEDLPRLTYILLEGIYDTRSVETCSNQIVSSFLGAEAEYVAATSDLFGAPNFSEAFGENIKVTYGNRVVWVSEENNPFNPGSCKVALAYADSLYAIMESYAGNGHRDCPATRPITLAKRARDNFRDCMAIGSA